MLEMDDNKRFGYKHQLIIHEDLQNLFIHHKSL